MIIHSHSYSILTDQCIACGARRIEVDDNVTSPACPNWDGRSLRTVSVEPGVFRRAFPDSHLSLERDYRLYDGNAFSWSR